MRSCLSVQVLEPGAMRERSAMHVGRITRPMHRRVSEALHDGLCQSAALPMVLIDNTMPQEVLRALVQHDLRGRCGVRLGCRSRQQRSRPARTEPDVQGRMRSTLQITNGVPTGSRLHLGSTAQHVRQDVLSYQLGRVPFALDNEHRHAVQRGRDV